MASQRKKNQIVQADHYKEEDLLLCCSSGLLWHVYKLKPTTMQKFVVVLQQLRHLVAQVLVTLLTTT